MNTTKNLKLNCLYKINRTVKQCGKMKQDAYNNGNHLQCREYKILQQQLYLLKSLTIMDMKDKQELAVDDLCVDDNGCILATFTGNGYTFHEISQYQENFERETLKRMHNKPEDEDPCKFWRPYVYYLTNQLSDQYRHVYDVIAENSFSLYGSWASSRCFELFNELDIKAEILWFTFDFTNSYSCALYIEGCKLCTIKIYVPEDWEILCEDGVLKVDTFDLYRDVDFSQY